MTETENVHPHEINKFGSLAERWWDLQGEFKTLHDINPLRIQFITEFLALPKKKIVDVGCGGGILSEGLAKAGSKVTGIDLSPELIDIADLHGLESGIKVDYKIISAEAFAQKNKAKFDYVTCMEMLEHVPDPSAIVTACAEMVKPGGYVFFSTLNRKPKAYLLAILGAEYLLNMLPKGTHDYKTFIKPSELTRWTRSADLEMRGMIGIEYNPLTRNFYLSKSVDVNYIAAYQRPK